jgi:hypothetical protein
MTWILVVIAFAQGGLYNSSPAAAISSVPGFRTEDGCIAEGKKLHVGNEHRIIMTFCLDQSK